MGKRYKHLFSAIVAEENIRLGYQLAAKGKRSSKGFLDFKEFSEFNLWNIENELIHGSWQPGEMDSFYIYIPKKRLISAPPFRDRVVHHSLCNVIQPIFERLFLPTVFACRPGKGTHAGVRWVQSQLRKNKFSCFLKTDFSKYFPSINQAILLRLIKNKITCPETLELISKIISHHSRGLPIGALTSQLFANLYGTPLDRFLWSKSVPFARYMDDIVVLGHSNAELNLLKDEIQDFSRKNLELNFSHWQVSSISRGINFLGYRIWPTHKLLRKDSVRRAKRAISAIRGRGDDEALRRFIASWGGHAGWANSYNLKKQMGLF